MQVAMGNREFLRYRWLFCSLAVLLFFTMLVSCSEEKPLEEYIVNSPDDEVVALISSENVGLNAVRSSVYLGTKLQKKSNDLKQVFFGTSVGADVFWRNDNTLIVLLCRGRIEEITSTYYVTNDRPVYLQVVTAPQIILDGKLLCDFDPKTGFFK
ncbi:hypothetical protein [Emcibacter sp.]|uniref:hypothetical protein n=1 Tax=Emcibacter sp. TaxID=1979954 RepID=UPI002AA8194E|nr:hypothetical protein [Emcibacter sp.]